MLDSFTYTNHLGEIIEFGKGNILIDSNELRNYEWQYNSYYGKISGFKKKARTLSISVLVYGDEANATADRIYEVLEKDVISGEHGKISINNYYCYGYIYGSDKVNYLKDGILKFDLKIATDNDWWIRESVFQYRPIEEVEGDWLTYPHVYPYTYKRRRISVGMIYNDSFVSQNVRIIIYGACENPSVLIGGHYYTVNCSVSATERLEIDTAEKTIYKISDSGVKTNYFRYRDTTSYIFEKVPIGVSAIQTYPSNVDADIIVLEERSEPRWVRYHDHS